MNLRLNPKLNIFIEFENDLIELLASIWEVQNEEDWKTLKSTLVPILNSEMGEIKKALSEMKSM